MVAFNYKKQFAEDIEMGVKTQTIRADRKDGKPPCKRGDALQHYTGMRTKQCRKLIDGICTSVDRVKIMSTSMEINGRCVPSMLYSRDQIEPTDNEVAEADGFESFMDMADWFAETHGLPFEGWIIKWDPRW